MQTGPSQIQIKKPLYLTAQGLLFIKTYSAVIAPVGQAPSHAPQSTQEAASTTAVSSRVIAPTGQVSTQAPQATQASVTVWAIVILLISVLCDVSVPLRPCTAGSASVEYILAFQTAFFKGRNGNSFVKMPHFLEILNVL